MKRLSIKNTDNEEISDLVFSGQVRNLKMFPITIQLFLEGDKN